MKPTLLVINGSTRPGRVGASIAEWVTQQAQHHATFQVQLADLAEINLPVYDEPNHPRLGRYVHEHTQQWSAVVSSADAVVAVMPEYNHSFNAALKNAIDYLFHEWAYKPVGLVSYGGVSAGLRAAQAIKPVFVALRAMVSAPAVTIPMVAQMIDDNDVFTPTPVVTQSATEMLDELARLEQALRGLRQENH